MCILHTKLLFQPLPNTAPTAPHHPILFTSHKTHKPCRNQILAVKRFQDKMFWSPLSEIHIRRDLLFSSSSKGKKINFCLYHKYNNDFYNDFYTFTWGQVDPLLNVMENSCQLIFTASRYSQADPSFYVITELSEWSSGVIWCFAWIQQMCTIRMKCWLLILHCQCWWKPGIRFLGGSSVLDKVLNTTRAAEDIMSSGIYFPDLTIWQWNPLGRFAIDFSMVRISEMRL